MNTTCLSLISRSLQYVCPRPRWFSTSNARFKQHCCKLLVVGGGSAGCSIAARFSRTLTKCDIIMIEPNEIHYYQPLFTLVGAGVNRLQETVHPTIKTIPENVSWFKDSVAHFCPEKSSVVTAKGHIIEYDFMVIATGLEVNFEKIEGLQEALDEYQNVCTVFVADYVEKTFQCLQRFASGNAIFTLPRTPVKCMGASQKICYLAEHYFRKNNKRCDAKIIYASGLSALFHVKKYDDALTKFTKRRKIEVCLNRELVKIIPDQQKAIFQCTDNPTDLLCLKYSLLHVTPPMSAPTAVQSCKDLVSKDSFVDVDKYTLRHKRFSNIFALGDCASLPTSKTASAISVQAFVVHKNLSAVMEGEKPIAEYSGYSACPIVTGYGTCLLAEFDYTRQPVETMPFSQDTDSKMAYFVKKHVLPWLYWHFIITGRFNGPEIFRKIFHAPSAIKQLLEKSKQKFKRK